jgi:hypothetical protein
MAASNRLGNPEASVSAIFGAQGRPYPNECLRESKKKRQKSMLARAGSQRMVLPEGMN